MKAPEASPPPAETVILAEIVSPFAAAPRTTAPPETPAAAEPTPSPPPDREPPAPPAPEIAGSAASAGQGPAPLANPDPGPGAPETPPVSVAEQARSPDVAADCHIVAELEGDLQRDSSVRQALARVPVRARSVANAIMLWDGQWAAAEALGGEQAVGPIRNAIVSGIRRAPASCQVEQVSGPRLIAIRDAQGTTLLAVGSGVWRWSALAGEAEGVSSR